MKMFSKILNKFKKPVPTIEQALISSIQNQHTNKVLVDRDALFFLLQKLEIAKEQKQDLTYFTELFTTIINATNEGKTLLEDVKTAKNPRETLFILIRNQSQLSELWKAVSILFKVQYHLKNINEIITKYGK